MSKSNIGLLLGMAALASQGAMAWNDKGHEIAASIAEHYLSPEAHAEVQAMLLSDSDTLTAHDFVSEATWADKFRDSDKDTTKQRYEGTYRWHFADIDAGRPNIPAACFGQPALPPGTYASQGPAKDCVIDKVRQFAEELGNRGLSSAERLLALKYLENLVADLHEPLNVAIEGDTTHGMYVSVAARTVTPGDLYDYWDQAFVNQLGLNTNEIATRLMAQITPSDAALWASGTPQLWALEAHQLGVDRAYGILSTRDAQGKEILEDAYVDTALRTIDLQLSRAGVRLAYLIDEALAPSPVSARTTTYVKSGSASAGRAFAAATCSVCHVVSSDQQSSNEGALAPDFKAIADTRGISAAALQEFLSGPHPTMPKLKLTRKQTNDTIAYILSLHKKIQ